MPTMRTILFVVLGRYGKVASFLIDEFINSGQNYISLPWSCTRDSEPGIKEGALAHTKLRTQISKYNKIVFIDCLWGSNNLRDEAFLHSSVIRQIKSYFPHALYYFISTFEPNDASWCEYRNTKHTLEKLIINNCGRVVRIGFIINEKLVRHAFFAFEPKLFPFKDIFIPLTYSQDLASFLIKKSRSRFRCNSNLCSVYSECASIQISIPACQHFFHTKAKVNLPLIIPPLVYIMPTVKLVSEFLSTCLMISCQSPLYRVMQKIYSVLEQQSSINLWTDWIRK